MRATLCPGVPLTVREILFDVSSATDLPFMLDRATVESTLTSAIRLNIFAERKGRYIGTQ